MTKFVFVTGGVVSGLGKGITAASLGRLLKERGLKVSAQKLDPYMNVDPGTMSPFQHGEVFVTEDGAETDLDLGHYERFMDVELTQYSNLTSGKVYWNVLNRERNGGYLGETVQVIPHITTEIKNFIYEGARSTKADVVITEIGGTIGDIESLPFMEAIRQLSLEIGRQNCIFIHVTLVPYLKGPQEHKSKPTQHSVKELQSLGITPNIIVTRSDEPIPKDIRDKIALFCNVKENCVIENITLPCLYEAPIMLQNNGLDQVVCKELGIKTGNADMNQWKAMIQRIKSAKSSVTIAVVGKYVKLHDAYLSVAESLDHAGFELGIKVNIRWVDSEQLTEENQDSVFEGCHGILIPGGFGNRAIEGKIMACRYAREGNVPYFGICLGMHIAVIEYARNVCDLEGATSREFEEHGENLVIDLMPDQKGNLPKGGTMRLGSYPCAIKPDTVMSKAYKELHIQERHRHRFEFNNKYRSQLEQNGLIICGSSPDKRLVEAVELPNQSFFVGVQFHPEFKSRPNNPHPIFVGFVQAAMNFRNL